MSEIGGQSLLLHVGSQWTVGELERVLIVTVVVAIYIILAVLWEVAVGGGLSSRPGRITIPHSAAQGGGVCVGGTEKHTTTRLFVGCCTVLCSAHVVHGAHSM